MEKISEEEQQNAVSASNNKMRMKTSELFAHFILFHPRLSLKK